MGKTIILLAGDPATGKSYFCNKIRGQYPQFRVISQDAIKERLWDEYGFDSVEEKTALEMQSWEMFYEKMNGCKQNRDYGCDTVAFHGNADRVRQQGRQKFG